MIKYFSGMLERLRWRFYRESTPGDADGAIDPLAHPALKAMSARELADIPFERTRITSPAE
jgi:hypothetical protein